MPVVVLAGSLLLAPLAVGIISIALFGRKKRQNRPIGLLFHTVTAKRQPHCSYYSPLKFAVLLDRLADRNSTFSTVSEAACHDHDPDASSTVVITFDDGFESFHSAALPILTEHKAKVTVFPVAGYLGRSSTWDTLPPQTHLTKDQIKEIASLGHEIGSHTVTHANLALLDDADVERELSQSKSILEDIIGKPVSSLSFPFGQWNARVWKIARSLGYTAAASYDNGNRATEGIVRLWGVYSFDSVADVWQRAIGQPAWSNAVARGRVMPNFAKGTPMWKFRENYTVFRRT